jgi:hypothetical protein
MLAGAGIGLACSLIGAWANHLFAIRADRIKRREERSDREVQMLRERLMPTSEKLGRILGDIADPSRRMKELYRPKLTAKEEELRQFLGPATRALHEVTNSAETAIAARAALLRFMEEVVDIRAEGNPGSEIPK